MRILRFLNCCGSSLAQTAPHIHPENPDLQQNRRMRSAAHRTFHSARGVNPSRREDASNRAPSSSLENRALDAPAQRAPGKLRRLPRLKHFSASDDLSLLPSPQRHAQRAHFPMDMETPSSTATPSTYCFAVDDESSERRMGSCVLRDVIHSDAVHECASPFVLMNALAENEALHTEDAQLIMTMDFRMNTTEGCEVPCKDTVLPDLGLEGDDPCNTIIRYAVYKELLSPASARAVATHFKELPPPLMLEGICTTMIMKQIAYERSLTMLIIGRSSEALTPEIATQLTDTTSVGLDAFAPKGDPLHQTIREQCSSHGIALKRPRNKRKRTASHSPRHRATTSPKTFPGTPHPDSSL